MGTIVTWTTDFGDGSAYVAQMKGVLLSLAPHATLVDVTHGIPPQDVRAGQRVLAEVTPLFPAGSLHVAVVDPGVGTARRLVYAAIEGRHYLAPDNGLLARLPRPDRIVVLENAAYWRSPVSATFHGRDILAPVAGHLCRGVDPGALGQEGDSLVTLPWPEPVVTANGLRGEIVACDSFGNLIANVTRADFARAGLDTDATVVLPGVGTGGGRVSGLVRTYGERPRGTLVALFGSHDALEIAVCEGNAENVLNVSVGAEVQVISGSGAR